MVERGEGGYRRLSLDWADYDKYLGGALELETLPRWKLARRQLIAYLWLYLRSGRVRQLAAFMRKHLRAGLALVGRIALPARPRPPGAPPAADAADGVP